MTIIRPPKMHRVSVGNVTFANDLPFVLIAGPCQMESRDQALKVVDFLMQISHTFKTPLVYKTSFDKANRTSATSQRGVGLKKAQAVFDEIRQTYKIPVLTDVHEPWQCAELAEVVDILQIPAFLCRQTDLLHAAAVTGCVVNVKKGQFLAPWDVKNIVQKLEGSGTESILLTERGTSFGYNSLVVDMRSIPIMVKDTRYPVIIDATHAVQQPGGQGATSGGQREFAPVIARAAVSLGVAGVFIETHPDPDNAPSDGPNMVPLDQMPALVSILSQFDHLAKLHKLNLT